jgi:uncharacterized protein YcbK (DUF882 family)
MLQSSKSPYDDQYAPRPHNEEIQKKYNPDYVPFSSNSQHMNGIAADIVVRGIPADDVYGYLDAKYPGTYGLGRYNGRTHADVRKSRARWDNR